MLNIITGRVILVLCILWFIISIYLYIKDRRKDNSEEKFDLFYLIISNIIMPMVFAIIAFAIEFIVGISINANSIIVEECKYTTPIYCLNDDSKIEGRSYLFSGYIKENMVYRTIYLDGYGGKKMWEINANQSSVFEDEKNEIVVYGEKFESPEVEYWLKNTVFNICKSETRYEIHIPKNSITTDYKIDLK